jgi:hypothetical protein
MHLGRADLDGNGRFCATITAGDPKRDPADVSGKQVTPILKIPLRSQCLLHKDISLRRRMGRMRNFPQLPPKELRSENMLHKNYYAGQREKIKRRRNVAPCSMGGASIIEKGSRELELILDQHY